MGASVGQKGAFNDINMTPLIDIVLVVLIIMMVNIPIQIEEMGLKVPGPVTTPPPTPPPDAEQLVLALYEDGRMALNREVMSEQNALYEMTRRLRSMTNKNVFVDAHEKVPYGTVVSMVDLAREAGAANVGLAKMKPTGPLEPLRVSAGSGMPRGIFIGSPLVRGGITEKKADEAIQPLKGAMTQCYLTELASSPQLTGSLGLYFEVGPDGETGITEEAKKFLKPPAVEKDDVGDAELKACIEALLPSVRYEALGEGKTAWIRYTILFSPG
jgi:biopolymer transport protein TolR